MTLEDCLNDLTSRDDALAEAAVAKLRQLPEGQQPGIFAALQGLLVDPDVDRRWWAARALADTPDVRSPGLLIQALNDPDPSVRQCAALGLRIKLTHAPDLFSDPAVFNTLLAALLGILNDLDPLTARLAADALSAIGEPAVPQLLELLNGSDHAVRRLIIRILAEIGDSRAIPALLAALDEDSALMEYWANEGLERMGVGMTYFFP